MTFKVEFDLEYFKEALKSYGDTEEACRHIQDVHFLDMFTEDMNDYIVKNPIKD